MNGFYHLFKFVVHLIHLFIGLPVSDKAVDEYYV